MIFDSGRALLDAAFAFAGVNIKSYARGEATLASNFMAKPAKTVFSSDALYVNNVNLRFSQIDFLVRKQDLNIEPGQGDVMTDENGVTYEVAAPNGEPVWRWHTPDVMRIHTLRESK